MRPAVLTMCTVILALAACQATPELATLPHATLAGTHVGAGGDRVDSFRVLTIDGRSVLPVADTRPG